MVGETGDPCRVRVAGVGVGAGAGPVWHAPKQTDRRN